MCYSIPPPCFSYHFLFLPSLLLKHIYLVGRREIFTHREKLGLRGVYKGGIESAPPHWMSENYSSKEVYISKNKVSWNIHTKRNQKKNQRGYFWGFEIVRKSVRFCLFPFLFLLHIDHMPRVILISLYKVFNLSL